MIFVGIIALIKNYIFPIIVAIIATIIGGYALNIIQHITPVVVPSVVGMQLLDAENILISSGLDFKSEPIDGSSKNMVVNQSPKMGVTINRGAQVLIEYEIGNSHSVTADRPIVEHNKITSGSSSEKKQIILPYGRIINVRTSSEIDVTKSSNEHYECSLESDIVVSDTLVAKRGSHCEVETSLLIDSKSAEHIFRISLWSVMMENGNLLYPTTNKIEMKSGGYFVNVGAILSGAIVFVLCVFFLSIIGIAIDVLDVVSTIGCLPMAATIICIFVAGFMGLGVTKSIQNDFDIKNISSGSELTFDLSQSSLIAP